MKKRLSFAKKKDYNEYNVFNSKGQFLGDIAKQKIGRKEKWWFFGDYNPMDGRRDFWLGEDCLIEIANKIKELRLMEEVKENE